MPRPSSFPRPSARPRSAAIVLAGAVGFAVAALGGLALAKTFTLKVAKNAPVENILLPHPIVKHEAIAVSSRGFAVYTLSGETTHKFKCTSAMCLKFWPPVKVASSKGLSAAPGIKGKLRVVHRKGFTQLTLGGHPLYHFMPDKKKGTAGGNGIFSFGGTWHVVTASSHNRSSGSTTTGSTTTYPGYP